MNRVIEFHVSPKFERDELRVVSVAFDSDLADAIGIEKLRERSREAVESILGSRFEIVHERDMDVP